MAKASNLIGNKYGKLLVIERAENNKRGNTQWLCKCDCGKSKIALGYDLTKGRTVSCGCNSIGKISPSRIDRVGMRYGKLVVKRLSDKRAKNGGLKWICQCDCGNEVEVQSSNLTSGRQWHCGCVKHEAHNKVNLIGERYGRLIVVEYLRKDEKRGHIWKCQCDCGNVKESTTSYLRSGGCKSCGCLDKEHRKKTKNLTHGLTKSVSYRAWRSMKSRCNPKNKNYKKQYYDRGITVCERWKSFELFYEDVSKLEHFEEKGYSLDRIDNDKGYEPNNVRWADAFVQENNKTTNVHIEYLGKSQTLTQWCRELDLPYGRIKARHKRGMNPPELFAPYLLTQLKHS